MFKLSVHRLADVSVNFWAKKIFSLSGMNQINVDPSGKKNSLSVGKFSGGYFYYFPIFDASSGVVDQEVNLLGQVNVINQIKYGVVQELMGAGFKSSDILDHEKFREVVNKSSHVYPISRLDDSLFRAEGNVFVSFSAPYKKLFKRGGKQEMYKESLVQIFPFSRQA